MDASYQEALGRSATYEYLSLAFLYPVSGLVERLRNGGARLAEVGDRLDWPDVASAAQSVLDKLRPFDDDGLEKEYAEVFGHAVSADCAPYEAEYGQAHVFQKSQTLADLGTFYRAFGVGLNSSMKDRLDHISVEMEFMHLLTLKEAYAIRGAHGADKVALCRDAQQAFLVNHLSNWITEFASRLARKAGSESPYGGVEELLQTHMKREFARFSLNAASVRAVPSGDRLEEQPAECGDDGAPVLMTQEVMKR